MKNHISNGSDPILVGIAGRLGEAARRLTLRLRPVQAPTPCKSCVILLSLLAATAQAGPRTSASYNVPTDTADCGGRRSTSASYTNDGSAGGVAGTSTVAAPVEVAKNGYIGQLYDVAGLVVSATSTTINETGTLQLSAAQFLDDSTTLTVSGSSVAWSVASGPLASINASGLATAGTVYQNTPATARGIYLSNTSTLNLTVLDSIADNFGGYAGDAIGDDWQVQYFGQPPNANAGPNVDYDHTGQTNLFKYIAGLNPLDPNSRFTVIAAPVNGQPGQKAVVFTPTVAGRTYTVKFGTDLAGWQTLTGGIQSDNGNIRTIIDPNATGAKKFYRVQVSKP